MEKIKIAVTGGPSGGKTTLIEALHHCCGHGVGIDRCRYGLQYQYA